MHTAARQHTPPRARKHQPAPVAPEIIDPNDLPDEYGMIVRGDCLEPMIGDGYVAGFSKSQPFKPGDFVVMFLKPELALPGRHQCAIKRLVMAPPPWVTFPWTENPKSEIQALVICEQLNPQGQFATKCADLLAIHRCIGWAPR
jgi:hypothetical protein